MVRRLTPAAIRAAIRAAIERAARKATPVFALRSWRWSGGGVPGEAEIAGALAHLAGTALGLSRGSADRFGFATSGHLWALVVGHDGIESLTLGVELAGALGGGR